MKKLLYSLLAVTIIFTACKEEEEEGCSDPNAINYTPGIGWQNDDGSCCYNIVGSWWATNAVIDSTLTVSYMGETIDSLSSSGAQTITVSDGPYLGPTSLNYLSNGIVYVEYNWYNYTDTNDYLVNTANYLVNGNILLEEGGFYYSVNCKNLSLIGGKEMAWTEIEDFGNGPIEIDIHLQYSNTLNFLRNRMATPN
jgi:hypothetical protein